MDLNIRINLNKCRRNFNMKKLFVRCFSEGKVRCGGWVETRAKTDKGLFYAALKQVWTGSAPAMCGYKLESIFTE